MGVGLEVLGIPTNRLTARLESYMAKKDACQRAVSRFARTENAILRCWNDHDRIRLGGQDDPGSRSTWGFCATIASKERLEGRMPGHENDPAVLARHLSRTEQAAAAGQTISQFSPIPSSQRLSLEGRRKGEGISALVAEAPPRTPTPCLRSDPQDPRESRGAKGGARRVHGLLARG